MSSGKSMQLLCILPFGMLCLSAISMMFVKLCSQCVYWWVMGMVVREKVDSLSSINCVQLSCSW